MSYWVWAHAQNYINKRTIKSAATNVWKVFHFSIITSPDAFFPTLVTQVSLSSAGQVAKEMAKVSISNEQLGSQNSAKGKAKKDAGKGGKELEIPRDKPKRKGPLDAVPLHPEDWALYDVPDEVG